MVVDQEQVDRIDVSSTHARTLRVVQNSRSPGLPGARSTGLLLAQTPIVAFCDDDDEWAPDKLERQVPRLGRSGEIAVGSGLMIVRDGRPSVVRLAKASRLTHADFVRHRNMEVHPSSLIFSRERLLSEVGLVDESIPGGYAEDYEYMLRVTAVSDMAVIPEPLVRVRWHEGSWFNDRWDTISAALRYLLSRPGDRVQPAGIWTDRRADRVLRGRPASGRDEPTLGDVGVARVSARGEGLPLVPRRRAHHRPADHRKSRPANRPGDVTQPCGYRSCPRISTTPSFGWPP